MILVTPLPILVTPLPKSFGNERARPPEIHCKKGARKLVRASVEHASSNEAFVVLRSVLPFSSKILEIFSE
jgi:hypothetical protein